MYSYKFLAQCFSETRMKVSKCRQCCTSDLCNDSYIAGELNTDLKWADTTSHETS